MWAENTRTMNRPAQGNTARPQAISYALLQNRKFHEQVFTFTRIHSFCAI